MFTFPRDAESGAKIFFWGGGPNIVLFFEHSKHLYHEYCLRLYTLLPSCLRPSPSWLAPFLFCLLITFPTQLVLPTCTWASGHSLRHEQSTSGHSFQGG